MLAELKQKWKLEKCSHTPARAEEISLFEQERGLLFPSDFRSYLLEVNGTSGDGDNNLFEFYPLHKLKTWREEKWALPPNAPASFNADKFYIFADYLISCWAYAIRLDNAEAITGQVIACGWREFAEIADSFTEFIDLYLSDDRRIYPPTLSGERA